ncbi:MAG: Tol-Pal system beta propeller repeat protein TolB [Nitrospinota bacterium]|nr:MAG: Tol-Pal system beta propeller repeat protein TolB [Nitrospinota bacterium]
MRSGLPSFITLIIALLGLGIVTTQGAEVYLHIQKGGMSKIRIAAPPFTPLAGSPTTENGLGGEMATILRQDLRFSTLFQPIGDLSAQPQDPPGGGEGSKRPVFAAWDRQGAQFLVQGKYERRGKTLVMECRIYEVPQGRMIGGKRYRGHFLALRTMVHKCADEVVYRLTGEAGIAQTKIVFLSPVQGHKELFIMDYDGANVYQLTYDRSLVLTPAWSPLGSELLFTSYREGNPSLYVMRWNGTKRRPLATYPGLNTAPAWSPDGERIALVLSKDGNAEIYTMRRDGTGLRRLTTHPAIDSAPTWSPDGRQIAFTSDRSGSPQIYIMEADGTRVRRVTYEGTFNDLPAWSPAGEYIAYTGREESGEFNIYTIRVDGTGRRRLTAQSGDNEHPTWSPDGRLIAFASTRNGVSQIFAMNADGTNQRLILAPPGGGFSPAWSPRFSPRR